MGSDRLHFISFYVSDVSVAVIEKSWNFFGVDSQWQGILGLAFDNLLMVSMVVINGDSLVVLPYACKPSFQECIFTNPSFSGFSQILKLSYFYAHVHNRSMGLVVF